MKTYLKGLVEILVFSLILTSIECQRSDSQESEQQEEGIPNLSDKPSPEETNVSSASESPSDVESTPIVSNISVDSIGSSSEPSSDEVSKEVDNNFGEFANETVFTPGIEITVPMRTGVPDINVITGKPKPKPESKEDYEWFPIIVIVLIFSVFTILAIICSIRKCSAIKKAEADHKGGEEKQISGTVHKDDKPDEAPAMPSTSSDTPKSSIGDKGKPVMEPTIREEESLKFNSSSLKSKRSTISDSDVRSGISNESSDEKKSVSSKEGSKGSAKSGTQTPKTK